MSNHDDYVRKAFDEERKRLDGPSKEEFFQSERELERSRNAWRDYEPSEAELARIEREIEMSWVWEQDSRASRRKEHPAQLLAKMPRRAAEVALTIEANTTEPAIVGVAKWMASDRNIAVLSGPPGVGKTVGAVWWARMTDRLPLFVTATEIAKASRFGGEQDRWLDAWYLIVDDLGAEFLDAKGSLLTDIDELVDTFYRDPRRRLLITTNALPKVFTERYGQRIADRLREAGTWIAVTGESRRKAKP